MRDDRVKNVASRVFGLVAVSGALAVPVLAWETFDQRTDRLLDSLSTRGVNVGQVDGPHRAARTGFWTTEGRLTRGITLKHSHKASPFINTLSGETV